MLLEVAEKGLLLDTEVRERQVARMLADPRSRALGSIFAGEWLGTHNVGPRIRKDPIDNPWCTESLMKAMREETAWFVHSLIAENAPVARLIDADYTFLNEELARFYRIRGVEGEEMRRVSLESSHRGGILGHASVLAATSFPDRTSPVLRGTWILTTLLGTPPPPPPPSQLQEQPAASRQRSVAADVPADVHERGAHHDAVGAEVRAAADGGPVRGVARAAVAEVLGVAQGEHVVVADVAVLAGERLAQAEQFRMGLCIRPQRIAVLPGEEEA
mgnify:CR=1 FL=1